MIDPLQFDGPKLGEASLQTSRDGIPIPIGWGLFAVSGNIIAMTPFVDFEVKSGSKKTGQTNTPRRSRTFAIGIARGPDGPITGIRRVWENNKLVYDGRASPTLPAADSRAFLAGVTIHLGADDQLPDPELEAHFGVGTTPAYRGLPYIVFNNKDLTDFASSIPIYKFEISPSEAQIAYVLTRTAALMQYIKIDYNSGTATILGTLALTGGIGESGFASDGQYVLTANVTNNDLYSYRWDGSAFVQTTSTVDVDVAGLDGLFGGDGFWICAGSAGSGVSTGVWNSGFIDTANTSLYPLDLSAKGVMDFRSSTGGIPDHGGYGDMYVASAASAADNLASFTLDNGGGSPPTILDTTLVGTSHVDMTGHDRHTGDICLIVNGAAGTEFIRRWELNQPGHTIGFRGDIVIGVQIIAATFYRSHLVMMKTEGAEFWLRSYSMDGVIPTLVDSIDLSSFFTAVNTPYIHTDPFSDYMILGNVNTSTGAVAVEMRANGRFNTTVVDLQTSATVWTQVTNGVHFLNAPLTVTP